MRLVPESEMPLGDVAKVVLGHTSTLPPLSKTAQPASKCLSCGNETAHGFHLCSGCDDVLENEGKLAIGGQFIAKVEVQGKPEYPGARAWPSNGYVMQDANGKTTSPVYAEAELALKIRDRAIDLHAKAGAKTWRQIRAEQDPDGKQHDLTLICTECGNSSTCRCTKPKRTFAGICDACFAGGPEAYEKQIREAIKNDMAAKGLNEFGQPLKTSFSQNGPVFVFEDDQERIAMFKKAFGQQNIVATASVSEALSALREGGFSKIYLDRDVSNPNETGEDLAWTMEKEALCRNVPIVIHSENTRGQKVMARYIGRYHSNVKVIPFRQLKRQLDIPGAQA